MCAAVLCKDGIALGSAGAGEKLRQASRMSTSASIVMPMDLCLTRSTSRSMLMGMPAAVKPSTNCRMTSTTTVQCRNWDTAP